MDAFKLYLPSNACGDRFPSNTPSDYCTQLSQSLNLTGKWEVGVESLYSAAVEKDPEDPARISFDFSIQQPKLINEEESHPFRLTDTWPGYEGATPPFIEENAANVDKVIKCMNSLNNVILRDGVNPMFQFKKEAMAK